jgi:hypothetical protein
LRWIGHKFMGPGKFLNWMIKKCIFMNNCLSSFASYQQMMWETCYHKSGYKISKLKHGLVANLGFMRIDTNNQKFSCLHQPYTRNGVKILKPGFIVCSAGEGGVHSLLCYMTMCVQRVFLWGLSTSSFAF